MTKLRKFTSVALGLSMLLTSVSPVFAEANNADDIMYTYTDAETGNDISVTRAELLAEHWNLDYINNSPVEPYADFPISIESDMNNRAELSLNMLYLKSVGENDSVTLTVTERDTNIVFMEEVITAENDFITLEDVPMGMVYNLTLNETLDGENEIYRAVITTDYESAGIPSNISLTSVTDAEDVMLKIDEARTDSNIGQELEDYLIPAEQLPELYSTLANNKLYIIQVGDYVNGQYENYKGFFSKSMSELGIFIPRYKFYTEDSYIALLSQPSTMSSNVTNDLIGETDWTIDDLNAEATNYLWNRDIFLNLPINNKYYKVYKYSILETSTFRVRTFGNNQTVGGYWTYDPENDILSGYHNFTNRDSSGNIIQNLGQAEDTVLYVLIYLATGKTVFNIERTDVTDDVGNSVYELSESAKEEDLLRAGSEGAIIENSVYSSYNTILNKNISYGGDVDVFVIDRNNNFIDKNYSIRLTNNGTANSAIKGKIFVDAGLENGWVYEETDAALSVNKGELSVSDFRMSSDYKYFVDISLATNRLTTSYQLEILHPNYPDALEGTTGNNSQANATLLPSDSGYYETVTLHNGDVDYFKFNTGAGGADADIMIYVTESDKCYNVSLLGTGFTTINGANNGNSYTTNRIQATNLPANTDCYIKVSSSGTNYSPGGTYWLQYDITKHTPVITYSAVLSENVAISKTVGTDSTIDSVKNTIAESATFYSNTDVVASTTALADADVYYTNGSTETLLTTDILNSLTAGTYTLTLKYHDVSATGGTITLTVSEPATEPTGITVELTTVTVQGVTSARAAWDWAACAQMAANSRRVREGSTTSPITYASAISAIKGSANLMVRGDITETAQAADYIYTGINQVSLNFLDNVISENELESYCLSELQQGKTIILLMTSKTSPTNMSLARYILLCGINTTNHTYKIIDPVGSQTRWITESELLDGYNSNTDLEFTGSVIEFI